MWHWHATCDTWQVTSKFLKVTVSWSYNRTKIFWLCAKSWDLHAQSKKICIFTLQFFFFMFHTYLVISSDTFPIFLAQNCKTEVLTAQKNLLLECLVTGGKRWTFSQNFSRLALTVWELDVACDTLYVIPDTWHVTFDIWHVSRDTQRVLNIVSKFQVPST